MILLLAPIAHLLTHKLQDPINLILMIIISLFSLVIEKQVMRHSTVTIPKHPLPLLPLLGFLALTLTAALPGIKIVSLLIPAALLSIIGLIIYLNAVKHLAQHFNSGVNPNANHSLITTGIYAYVRHPKYLGIVLIGLALSLTIQRPESYAALITMLIGYAYRIHQEEQQLAEHYGEHWMSYRACSKRFIPLIY